MAQVEHEGGSFWNWSSAAEAWLCYVVGQGSSSTKVDYFLWERQEVFAEQFSSIRFDKGGS